VFLRGAPKLEVLPLDPEVLSWQATLPRPTTSTAAASATNVPAIGWVSIATLQQGLDGYDGASDTGMDFYQPDVNLCRAASLSARAGNKAAMLLRFDLTRLPARVVGLGQDALIRQATLSFYVVQGRSDTRLSLFLPLCDWDPCATTWNVPWQKPGADGSQDRSMEPLREWTTVKSQGWIDVDITPQVQEWLRDPDHNYGLLLKCFEDRWPSNEIIFSSDHPAASSRPKLTIKYEVVPPRPSPTPTLTATPSVEPTATPTPGPTATPLQPLGPRVIELRWYERMNIGNAYPVTVVFRPAEPSAALPPGVGSYWFTVAAHLTAPSFEVDAASAEEQVLEDANGVLTWTWTVRPRAAGSQVLSFDLRFLRAPALGTGSEPGMWYCTRAVAVGRPYATWAQVNRARNELALFGMFCVILWYAWRRLKREK
jgi:hypothetical protein